MSRAVSRVQGPIKLAVTLEGATLEGDENCLCEYNPVDSSIEDFIKDLCNHWKLSEPSTYMLKFNKDEQNNHYVYEGNKHLIQNGEILFLVLAAPLKCEDIKKRLHYSYSEKDKEHAIGDLLKLSTDPTFADFYIQNDGIKKLMEEIMRMYREDNSESLLEKLLHSFTNLLNIVSSTTKKLNWDICSDDFVNTLTRLAETDIEVMEVVRYRCLIALQLIVETDSDKHRLVEKSLQLLRLVQLLGQSKEVTTRCAVLGLITAIFARAEPKQQQEYYTKLSERKYRSYITEHVLPPSHNSVENEVTRGLDVKTSYQLHKLQRLLLNQLQPRLVTGVLSDDKIALEKIISLRKVAFHSDTETENNSGTERIEDIKKEFKMLGFKSGDPTNDFNEVPPGVLALDNLHYFCLNRPEQYSKLVLENCYRSDDHECPIGRASIDLTQVLADILKIGVPPAEDCSEFHPMLFTNDHSFEELFCICITLLNKTWKEMKATTEDFSKVLSVVREQITRALKKFPSNLDQFHNELQKLPYKQITSYWQEERMRKENLEKNAPQIQKLRLELTESLTEVVKQQRLRILQAGAKFKNPIKKNRNFFFCRLSTNHKFFHYDECDEKATKMPTIEELSRKISVSDIKSIAVGKECPPNITRRKHQYVFSLMLESGKTEPESLDFVPPDEYTFNTWIDGIKVLLRESMCSDSATKDLDKLLDIEIKLQMLDLEGVHIPSEVPSVPPLPPNYNFCCNL